MLFQGTSAPGAKEAAGKKKEEPAPELTTLEKMLQNAGPLRNDGTDKFFGLENVRVDSLVELAHSLAAYF